MKIAFDNQVFNFQRYGGISRYHVRLASNLSENQKVKVFAGLHKNNYLCQLSSELVYGKKIKYPPKGGKYLLKTNNLINNFLIPKWEPDIIHKTYYFNRFNFQKPTILTVHDMIHEIYNDKFSPNDKTSFYKREAVKNAQHIIAISESTRNDLINLFNVDEAKVSVVYHGYDAFDYDVLDVPILNQKPFILYVGDRQAYKNFKVLLNAYANSSLRNDFNLIAFGGGKFDSEEIDSIKDYKLPLDSVFQMSGDDALLATVYKKAHVFVYPSLYEGFGFPVLESMANDCAVISSNSSSMPEVVGNGGALFNPFDAEELTVILQRILDDEEYRSTLIKKGKKNLERFSWKKCSLETSKVYSRFT